METTTCLNCDRDIPDGLAFCSVDCAELYGSIYRRDDEEDDNNHHDFLTRQFEAQQPDDWGE